MYFICQYSVFYGEYEKQKKTKTKNPKNYHPRRGFEPWIFEQVPNQNLNFEGDWINRAHGS